jgi:cyclophilin family peptidyl-prolyl cis-trans isomerase
VEGPLTQCSGRPADAAEAALTSSIPGSNNREIRVPKKLFIVIAALAFVLGASACGGSDKTEAQSEPTTPTTTAAATCPEAPAVKAPTSKNNLPVVKLETSCGDIYIEMDTKEAPIAAGRFIDLVEEGFYDGLTFHRVIPDFVIQGGDPDGNGTGGKGNPVVGETPKDGYPIGSLAAAKAGSDPDGSFDSQFFIVTGAQGTQLPPQYARFGQVIAGLEVAENIQAVERDPADAPLQKVTIEKATVTGA